MQTKTQAYCVLSIADLKRMIATIESNPFGMPEINDTSCLTFHTSLQSDRNGDAQINSYELSRVVALNGTIQTTEAKLQPGE